MINIQAEDTNGEIKILELEENPSGNLMEALVANGMDVPAICGGMAGCGTCHISIKEGGQELHEPEEDEAFMLESLSNRTPTSRLSCQLPLTEALKGVSLKILGDR